MTFLINIIRIIKHCGTTVASEDVATYLRKKQWAAEMIQQEEMRVPAQKSDFPM